LAQASWLGQTRETSADGDFLSPSIVTSDQTAAGAEPFPLPNGVQVPIYFTIQPGGPYVEVGAGRGRRSDAEHSGAAYADHASGAYLVYPNDTK
jgi:hypothetical protein